MSEEINQLFEINVQQKPVKKKDGFIISLLSLPLAITLVLAIITGLFYIFNFFYEGLYYLLAFSSAVSILCSCLCSVYGLWHWQVLTVNQKILVTVHNLILILFIAGILFISWLVSQSSMK